MLKKIFVILIGIFTITSAGLCQNKNADAKVFLNEYKLKPEESAFLDKLEHKTFLFFIGESNRENGLVKDRSTKDSPASIAAVGFALPAYAVGAEHGWITRKEAAERTLNTLNFFLNSKQSPDAVSTGYK